MKVDYLIVSDTHLMNRFSKVQNFLRVLDIFEFDKLIIVGDFLDFYPSKLKFGPQEIKAIRKLLKISKKKEIVYIIGNHELKFSEFVGHNIGNISLVEEFKEDGALYLHGHRFDLCSKMGWLWRFGDIGYQISIRANVLHSWFCKKMNIRPKETLSQKLKRKVKSAVSFIDNFEVSVAEYAKSQGCHTVICGHIHKSSFKSIDGVTYINCGDFLEDTSFVTKNNGEYKLWTEENFYQLVGQQQF